MAVGRGTGGYILWHGSGRSGDDAVRLCFDVVVAKGVFWLVAGFRQDGRFNGLKKSVAVVLGAKGRRLFWSTRKH